MKLKAKELIEILSVIAVVISLLLVASELRQANNIALRDSRIQANLTDLEMHRLAFESVEFVQLREKLRDPYPELSQVESALANDWAIMTMDQWGNIAAGIDAGLLPLATAEAWGNAAVAFIEEYPGISPIISERARINGVGKGYSPLFDRILERISE